MARLVTRYTRASPPLVPGGGPPADEFRAEMEKASPAARTAARNKLTALGWTAEQVRAVVPRKGRARVPGLSAADLRALAPFDPPCFGHSPERASRAADVLTRGRPPATASNKLTSLRNWMRRCPDLDTATRGSAGDLLVAATFRPKITQEKNDDARASLVARSREGFTVPPPWRDVGAYCARLRGYAADPAGVFAGGPGREEEAARALADLSVGLVARPGEMEPGGITVHADIRREPPRYFVSNVLKKRTAKGRAQMFPLLSGAKGCQADLVDLFDEFRALPPAEQRRRLKEMRAWLAEEYDVTPKDLRMIGSELAVKASGASTDTARMMARSVALRHAAIRSPVLNYGTIAEG